MALRIGRQSVIFEKPISIVSTASIVGPFEKDGPLNHYFDICLNDDLLNCESYEKAESLILKKCIDLAIKKNNMSEDMIDVLIGGDLLDQITATTFAAKEFNIPFWGIYNACSTFSLGIQIASSAIEGSVVENALVCASSHFSTSERQYRSPLELGCQNPITSQRTVTGCGCALLSNGGNGPQIFSMTTGRIMDMGEHDPFDMGAAMAAAAADTIMAHFKATNTTSKDYDLILTGDLANEGLSIAKEILKDCGYNCDNINDCGKLIYNYDNQFVNNGGSGAGCCASVFCGYIYNKLCKENINRLLFIPTGALLSPTTYLQNENIPSIAHAVEIRME